MRTAIDFPGYDPFRNTESSSLLALWDRCRPPSARNRDRLEELVQAELTWTYVVTRWKDQADQLVGTSILEALEATEPWQNHPAFTAHGLPRGYDDWRGLTGKGWNALLAEAEWLVSAVMDASYVLFERLAKSSSSLSKTFADKVWPDIHSHPGSGRYAVKQNLIDRFRNAMGKREDIEQLVQRILVLQENRGNRTHRSHLYAHVEMESRSVVYRDTTLWSAEATVEFTSHDLDLQLSGLSTLRTYWVGETRQQLQGLVSRNSLR